MNQRIRELLGQADIKFDKDLNDIDVCVLLPEDLEKFARLIVEECATSIAGLITYDAVIGIVGACK